MSFSDVYNVVEQLKKKKRHMARSHSRNGEIIMNMLASFSVDRYETSVIETEGSWVITIESCTVTITDIDIKQMSEGQDLELTIRRW